MNRIIIFLLFVTTLHAFKSRWHDHVQIYQDNKPWDWSETYKMHDPVTKAEKQMVLMLIGDLMKSADLKMRSILALRESHEANIAFNIGTIIGRIQDRWRTMLEIYKNAVDFRSNRSYFQPPGIRGSYYQHFFHFQEYIHRHQVSIDQYVNVLENIPPREFWSNATMISNDVQDVNLGYRLEKKEFYRIRRGQALNKSEVDKEIAEQRYKRHLREKYLLRRLGLPTNMSTPKKRFRNKWPVRETWEKEIDTMY